MNKIHSKSTPLPGWLWVNSTALPPLYRVVWEAVREDRASASQGEILVDTDKVFPLLLTTQLSMDILGHIWNIANRKYAGRLTEQELYIVLALVAVAQSSCVIDNLDVLRSVSYPVVPYLNLDRLSRSRTIIQPNAMTKPPTHIGESTMTALNSTNQIDLRSHVLLNKTKGKSLHGVNSDMPIANSVLERDFYVDSKMKGLGASPVTSLFQPLPQVDDIRYASIMEADQSDEFSDFQSAPPPPPPLPPPPLPNTTLPSIQIWDGKQGSAIGSRLANHNLGVKKLVDKSKKVTNANVKSSLHTNTQSNINLQNANSGALSLQNKDKDLMLTEQYSELFPKCTMKSHSKTVILRDTAIRSGNRSSDTMESRASFPVATIDHISADYGTLTIKTEVHPKVTGCNEQDISKKDLINVQHTEDKYSALRELITETSSLEPEHGCGSSNTAADEFGEFVSAEISNSAGAPIPDTVIEAVPDISTIAESTSHDYHVDSNNIADLQLTFGIHEALGNLKIADTHDDHCEVIRLDSTPELMGGKIMPKDDSISVNSIELGNGTPGILTRSGSVPSLDLKSFLPPNSDEDQIIDTNHQTMYWEWKQYMESCVLLLQVAANIFTSITTEAVLEEILNSAQGYYFLCNLAEVAAVCRRVNFSYKEMDICITGFDELLMDIDRIWAEMEPFYINIPIVTELPAWPLHQGESAYCSLCLTVISSCRVTHNENSYHVTCANLWLRCVSNHLPVMKYPPLYSQSTVCPVSSHL